MKKLPLYQTKPQSLTELRGRVVELLSLGWCACNSAIDENREIVHCLSENCCSVCLIGAICRACLVNMQSMADPLGQKFFYIVHKQIESKQSSIAIYNDSQFSVEPIIQMLNSIPLEEVCV